MNPIQSKDINTRITEIEKAISIAKVSKENLIFQDKDGLYFLYYTGLNTLDNINEQGASIQSSKRKRLLTVDFQSRLQDFTLIGKLPTPNTPKPDKEPEKPIPKPDIKPEIPEKKTVSESQETETTQGFSKELSQSPKTSENRSKMIDFLEIALNLHYSGFAVVSEYSSKNANWNPKDWTIVNREQQPELLVKEWFSEVNEWYQYLNGISLGLGNITKLYCIDFDTKNHPKELDVFDRYKSLVIDLLGIEFWQSLTIEKTKSNGRHIYFYCDSDFSQTNKELAKSNDTKKVFFEFLTQKVTCYPTPNYEILQNDFSLIPTLTINEVNNLIGLAQSFNEVPEKEYKTGKTNLYDRQFGETSYECFDSACINNPDLILDIFREYNWQIKKINSWFHLYRPDHKGKLKAPCATFGHIPNVFFSFSGSTYPFECKEPYNPSACYALLVHNGDFKASAKDLAEKGYGKKFESFERMVKINKTQPKQIQTAHESPPGIIDNQELTKSIVSQELTKSEILDFAYNGDEGLAKMIAKIYKNQYIYDYTVESWRVYIEGVWHIDQIQIFRRYAPEKVREILLVLSKELDNEVSQGVKDGVEITKLKTLGIQRDTLRKVALSLNFHNKISSVLKECQKYLPSTSEDFDKHLYLLNLNNGVFNFETFTLEPHSPEKYLTIQNDFAYNKDADCPKWIEFINTIFDYDKDLIQYIQKLCGLALTGNTNEQKFWFFYGGGANGKSVFVNALQLLISGYYEKTKPETFTHTKNFNKDVFLADLKGKRLVVAGEYQSNARLDTQSIKDFTGGEIVKAKRLFQNPFSFKPEAKLILYGNHKPIVTETDFGFWRRCRFIHFQTTIPVTERKPMDVILNEFRNEISGIFNWCVAGYKLYKSEGMKEPKSVEESTNEYKESQDVFAYFIANNCEKKADMKTLASKLFEYFSNWCDNEGEINPFRNTRAMTDYLKKNGVDVGQGAKNKTTVFGLAYLDFDYSTNNLSRVNEG